MLIFDILISSFPGQGTGYYNGFKYLLHEWGYRFTI